MKDKKRFFYLNNTLIKSMYTLLSKTAQTLDNLPQKIYNNKISRQINQNIIDLINKTTHLILFKPNKLTTHHTRQVDSIVRDVDKLDFHLATVADMKLLPKKFIQPLIKQCRQIIKFLVHKNNH